jgi:hypothetical protein
MDLTKETRLNTSKQIQGTSFTKTSLLIMFRETIFFFSESQTRHSTGEMPSY